MEKERGLLVRPAALGMAAAMGAYLALLALMAYLTVSGKLSEGLTVRAVWLCALLAAFVGAVTASRGKKGTKALPLICAAAFWASVSLIGLLAFGTPELNGVLSLLAASALGGLLAVALVRRGRGKRAKRRKTSRSRR